MKRMNHHYFSSLIAFPLVLPDVERWSCDNIPSRDLYNYPSYGRVKNFHLTLIYPQGDYYQLLSWIKPFLPFWIKLRKIGKFEKKDYDVIYLGVQKNDTLNELYQDLNRYSLVQGSYYPHITLAYVRKGFRLPEENIFDGHLILVTDVKLIKLKEINISENNIQKNDKEGADDNR